MKNSRGFSLLELLIYVGIFTVAAGLLTGILSVTLKVQTRESAANEVTEQLNFTMQTVQRLIRESSLIEMNNEATSTLKLRMKDLTKGVTTIYLENNAILMKEKNETTQIESISNLTSNKVIVDQLIFKKFSQYPGHDTVQIDVQMTYNSQNPQSRISRNLRSAIARVSAATFDSDVLPGSSYTYSLGQPGSPWQNIFMKDGNAGNPSYAFSNNVGLGLFRAGENILGFSTAGAERIRIDASGNLGIGTAEPGYKLTIQESSGTAEQLALVGTNSNTFTIGATGDNLYIKDKRAGATRMFLQYDGNVGIGTTNPGAKLDVGGHMYIRPISSDQTKLLVLDEISGAMRIYTDATNGTPGNLILGTYPNGHFNQLVLNQNSGNVGIGTTSPEAKLQVNGNTLLLADKKVDSVTSTYYVSKKRYHVEATKAVVGNTVPLDMTIINNLCKDEDGCTVMLGMRNWDPANRPGDMASKGPYKFFMSQTSNWWRLSTDTEARDADGSVAHILVAWACYLTDGEYTSGVGTDSSVQIGLLNWTEYADPNMVCVLDIDD